MTIVAGVAREIVMTAMTDAVGMAIRADILKPHDADGIVARRALRGTMRMTVVVHHGAAPIATKTMIVADAAILAVDAKVTGVAGSAIPVAIRKLHAGAGITPIMGEAAGSVIQTVIRKPLAGAGKIGGLPRVSRAVAMMTMIDAVDRAFRVAVTMTTTIEADAEVTTEDGSAILAVMRKPPGRAGKVGTDFL
ncbi:hypothetical protein NVSP9465_01086 [Novosphingobium sp. CECT 9465]|nr:hypothetical protein NVSP9465_01086 [Novosphingobium sp. CECT 9465]